MQPFHHPVSASRVDAFLILLSLVVLSATPFIAMAANIIAVLVIAIVLAVAAFLRSAIAAQLAILVLGACVWRYIWPSDYPFLLAGPMLLYFICVLAVPAFKPFTRWLQRGSFTTSTLILIIVTVLVSSTALVIWYTAIQPDLNVWSNAIPRLDTVWMLFIGVGFALFNAAVEELLFRGIILQSLDAVLGAGKLPIIIQGISFGFIHFTGVPSGWIGVGLAAIYGLFLGFVKRRAQGMLAPFIAHVFADFVIFVILLQLVTRNGPE